jgi:hypothetical protein
MTDNELIEQALAIAEYAKHIVTPVQQSQPNWEALPDEKVREVFVKAHLLPSEPYQVLDWERQANILADALAVVTEGNDTLMKRVEELEAQLARQESK